MGSKYLPFILGNRSLSDMVVEDKLDKEVALPAFT